MAGLVPKQTPCLEERNSMRSKRFGIFVPCLLIVIVVVAAEPPLPPPVAVIAARAYKAKMGIDT
jgi:hypothetical protein